MDTDLLHGEFAAAVARCGGVCRYGRVAGVSHQAVQQLLRRGSIMPPAHVPKVATHLGEPRSRFRPDLYSSEEAPASS